MTDAKIKELRDAYKAANAAQRVAAVAAYRVAASHAAQRAAVAACRVADDAWRDYQAALKERNGQP